MGKVTVTIIKEHIKVYRAEIAESKREHKEEEKRLKAEYKERLSNATKYTRPGIIELRDWDIENIDTNLGYHLADLNSKIEALEELLKEEL